MNPNAIVHYRTKGSVNIGDLVWLSGAIGNHDLYILCEVTDVRRQKGVAEIKPVYDNGVFWVPFDQVLEKVVI